jgi:hypothetical protein
MYRIVFSLLLGVIVLFTSSFPLIADGLRGRVSAARQSGARQGITGRQGIADRSRTLDRSDLRTLDRYRDARNYTSSYGAYGYPSNVYGSYNYPVYGSSYGAYNYPGYSSYSTYPLYPSTSAYPYDYYGASYYNPGMYNPNTVFVNPPSSLNYTTGYPGYSETYIYR